MRNLSFSSPAKSNGYRNSRKKLLGGFFVLFLGATVLLMAAAAQGPDRDLSLTREIRSNLPPARIALNLNALTRWPQWFHSLGSARILPPQTELEVKEGSVIQLLVDPGKGVRKQFDLTAKVTAYEPERLLELEVLRDSSGRLTTVFENLRWKVEILPGTNGGSILRGTATAHTCHWRSRLFGAFAEKIIMNQVFYPNLIKLSELRQPFSVEAPLHSQSGLWK